MNLNHMLEVEETLHEIEERANRNRLGKLVTAEVAAYRAHGAKKDVETLLAVVNGVLDKLVDCGGYAHSEDILNVIYEALGDHKEGADV